jgi:two-component system chemotaxis response regulator CheB
MMRRRVIVVEDSLTVRRHLVEVVARDPELEVVGEAGEGNQAIELCLRLRPDVVTMDMVLPGRSGLEITEHLMAFCPTPILVVSSSANRGELFQTYDALAAGAVEVLEKPTGYEIDDEWDRQFVATLKLVARIKVITHPRLKLGRLGRSRPVAELAPARPPLGRQRGLVVMGASTGGPGAVVDILRALPADFPLPILLVIHIGGPLGAAFADWLGTHSPIPVRYPVPDEPLPRRGKPLVVVAPPGRHLVVRDGCLRLTTDPPRHSCRPAVDALFESVAGPLAPEVIACLLTGMGRDGGAGLDEVRRAGGLTIAQDEATSVVFGMPREAIALGAAERVLPLSAIAPTLIDLAGVAPGRRE